MCQTGVAQILIAVPQVWPFFSPMPRTLWRVIQFAFRTPFAVLIKKLITRFLRLPILWEFLWISRHIIRSCLRLVGYGIDGSIESGPSQRSVFPELQVNMTTFDMYVAVFQNIIWKGKLSDEKSPSTYVATIGCEQRGQLVKSPDDRYNSGAVFCVYVKTRRLSSTYN